MSVKNIFGVFKAYSTRVGSGPMVTELTGDLGNAIRERAWEYGTTTGRPRRCGWFDGVAARYSTMVNGFTSAILTRLDVLDGLPSVNVCVDYRLDGTTLKDFPASSTTLEKCVPVYEELSGWDRPTASVNQFKDLPPEAVRYVQFLEKVIGRPIDLISTGPKRHETIVVRQVL